jgi:hypothetical protein
MVQVSITTFSSRHVMANFEDRNLLSSVALASLSAAHQVQLLGCLQVYQEPLCRRHYASIASTAAGFRVVIRVLAVVLAFLLAFATGGFWRKISHDVVQPTVHYSGDALMVLEVRQ